jgi:hypothetical protein
MASREFQRHVHEIFWSLGYCLTSTEVMEKQVMRDKVNYTAIIKVKCTNFTVRAAKGIMK